MVLFPGNGVACVRAASFEAHEAEVALSIPQRLERVYDRFKAAQGLRLFDPVIESSVNRERLVVHVRRRGKNDRGAFERKDHDGPHSLTGQLSQISGIGISLSAEPIVSQYKKAVEIVENHLCPDCCPSSVPFLERQLWEIFSVGYEVFFHFFSHDLPSPPKSQEAACRWV